MPAEISKLADTILTNPVRVEVTPVSSTANTVKQEVYFVEKNNKKSLLLHLLKDDAINTALVFTRTKHGADRVAKDLNRAGVAAEAIHGNKSQNARQKALSNFKSQHTRVLVATDIAARGIDIDELSHVINYELPNVPETYVHRIGRTGRAGASGISISFCDGEEKAYLKDIQKLIGKPVPVAENNPYAMSNTSLSHSSEAPRSHSQNQNKSHQGSRRSGGFKSGGFKRSSSSHTKSTSSSTSRKSNTSSSSARRPSRDWRSISNEKNY
jgi:ATP-dependent RNA helicase RhlE